MNDPDEPVADRSEAVLVLAPTGRDGALACEILSRREVSCCLCQSMDELIVALDRGAGAALIAEEAMTAEAVGMLGEALDLQPKWSEFPILIFTALSDELAGKSLNGFSSRANVTLVDRPIRIDTLVSSVRSALRARRHQYEVRDLLEELEQRVQERDQFLAMLGHELRNPLYAIALASENGEPATTEVASKLEIIRRQSRRLQRLVDDLLEISRVTRGKVDLDRRVMDLRKLVERSVEEMQPTARRDSRELTTKLPDEAVLTSIDEIRMEQVLINLIANSLKYTSDGGRIDVIVEADGDHAVIRVVDDGDGIEADVLPTVFELFAQARTRSDVHQGGLGLGLTLVQRLVELHGGTVEAASDGAGKGAEMKIILPRIEGAEEPPDEPKEEILDAGTTGSMKVLIVEDSEDIRALLAAQLERLGCEVIPGSTGPDGVRLALEIRPDLAIVDIGLPGFDGHEVARRIREELGDAIELVAVTGYGQPEDRERALEAGFDDHLTKPVDSSELQKMLSRRRPTSPTADPA